MTGPRWPISAWACACWPTACGSWPRTPVDPVPLDPVAAALYPFYVLCGVAILYSLMFAFAATSIWLGRNQSLYDFWFYLTNFSRYPMEIYQPAGLATAGGVHVHHSGAGRGERPGTVVGLAVGPRLTHAVHPAPVHPGRHGRQPAGLAVRVFQKALFSYRIAVTSHRGLQKEMTNGGSDQRC